MLMLNIALVLFLIMDPIGHISTVVKLLKGETPSKQRLIVLREMLFALAGILLFNFIGEYLFAFLDVSEMAVRLSSGIILFLVAMQILFPGVDSIRATPFKGKPFIIPIAMPLVAGPSLLATVMLYANSEPSQPLMLGAIAIAWTLALIILLLAPALQRLVGDNGLTAFERLLGMILVMVAIQRFMEGVKLFVLSTG